MNSIEQKLHRKERTRMTEKGRLPEEVRLPNSDEMCEAERLSVAFANGDITFEDIKKAFPSQDEDVSDD